MKTYEIWAEIVECEDGVQIDDAGDPAYMGVYLAFVRSLVRRNAGDTQAQGAAPGPGLVEVAVRRPAEPRRR